MLICSVKVNETRSIESIGKKFKHDDEKADPPLGEIFRGYNH